MTNPWPVERARQWHEDRPWLVGCNYVPSSAVNDVEMWQETTFDPATIDRELGWAAGAGLNSVRVFLNYVVWEANADGLKERLDQFFALASGHGISTMPVLFDDCAFAGKEPRVGPQDEPTPGVHNSGWVPSPRHADVTDRAAWPNLEHYVTDIVSAFGRDERVVVWDLYNEPGNSGMGESSLPLLEAAFAWARQAGPDQPLTAGVWTEFDGPMSRRMMALSDVVSFHGYESPEGVQEKLALCSQQGRPVLCTEWLRRQVGNTVEAVLPIFRDAKVGCYHWGLVAGRTQTYLHWGSKPGSPDPDLWQHDLFHEDGRPFREEEIALFRDMAGSVEGC